MSTGGSVLYPRILPYEYIFVDKTARMTIDIWKDLFLQYEWRIPHTAQRIQEALKNLRTQTLALDIHANRLRMRIREVGKLFGKYDDELNRLIRNAEKHTYPSVKKDTLKWLANVKVNKCNPNGRGSLTKSSIKQDMLRVYTQPAVRLIPGTLDTCHSCDVLLATRTPCILCSRCGRLVCSICYVFVNSGPDSKPDLPLCRPCDLIFSFSPKAM
ncbi:unnamed protein product [Rodentolepis nana]|uniref:RING-type domain-containing protein n=1 Tax=Rodentolepis nana TaxID=102285 RepID=A0A0R3TUJ3_RODNA|nr:unnamed protein product [Rodentolepis nana]